MNEDSYLHGIYDLTFSEFLELYKEELNEQYAQSDGLEGFADFALREYQKNLKESPEPNITTIDEEDHFEEELF